MKRLSYVIVSTCVLSVGIFSISACNKDKTPIIAPDQCADTVSFAGVVEPLIQANCSTSGCHDAASPVSGYNLEGYLNISANGSAILNVIRHESGVVPMPYSQPKLNDSIIETFNCWIAQGKLNN